jgi:hypothetical protein
MSGEWRVIQLRSSLKLKLKSLPGTFSTLLSRGPIVFLPQQVPAFISRGATYHTDARDLYQRRRELPPNFSSGSEFTRIPLGFFLHAAKLGHGTYYFTSPPKEGTLRIFWMPEKSNGFGWV